jgi:hypothetical protein
MPPRRLRRALELASRGAAPATREMAGHARGAVVTVSPRSAGQEGCLQRSVGAALMCRLYGRWPDWCTGFRERPFRAHAWIEAEGGAVGEHTDTALFHTVISVRARRPG